MIASIRLVNCQSWSDCTIHLASDKLNIIQAANNVGKSVLFKILKISVAPNFFNNKKRKKLIRWGATDAKAFYVFTDGSSAVVCIQPNRVFYVFKEANCPAGVATLQPPERLKEELGLLVNSDGTFIANIIDTDQNLLLVDSESKPTFEFMHMLCNNASIDDLLYKTNNIKDWLKDSRCSIDLKLNSLTYKLAQMQYTDVYSLERKLMNMTTVKELLLQLIKVANALNKIETAVTVNVDYDKLMIIVNALQNLEDVKFANCFVTTFNKEALNVCEMLLELEKLTLHKLHNCKEPPDLAFVGFLQKLENVDFNRIFVKEHRDELWLCDVLHKLEEIQMSATNPGDVPVDSRLCDGLDKLEMIQHSLVNWLFNKENADEISRVLLQLEEDIKQRGSEYLCPIYERVIFDGKECIPCDN